MPDMPKNLQQFRIRLDAADALRMSCADANCANWRNGFVIVLDPTDEKHRQWGRFIEGSGRTYARFVASDGAAYLEANGANLGVDLVHLRAVVGRALPHMLVYAFSPGQTCFKNHKDREVEFLHATRERVQTHSPLGFNEHWNEEGDRINQAVKRG